MKCPKPYKPGALKSDEPERHLSTDGCFNFIAWAIGQTFTCPDKNEEDKESRLAFIESDMISAFCDCTNNFERNKLINEFKKQKLMTKESIQVRIARTIILNRTLQTVRSPERKTLKQIAIRHNCKIAKVEKIERYINSVLAGKIDILIILLQIH